jgi:hypothetical protein
MICNVNGHVQRGNTIRLLATFKDWSGEVIDPDFVQVIVYDRQWQKINEQELGPDNHVETGKYFFNYVPERSGTFYFEWHGRIDGQPSLFRDTLIVRDI